MRATTGAELLGEASGPWGCLVSWSQSPWGKAEYLGPLEFRLPLLSTWGPQRACALGKVLPSLQGGHSFSGGALLEPEALP